MTPQEVCLQMIRDASFNNFDGPAVADSLIANRGLWSAAIMTRLDDLIVLRDLSDGWNIDTLFVLPVPGKEAELVALAQKWNADEVDWIGGDKACALLGSWSAEKKVNPQQILRVWFD